MRSGGRNEVCMSRTQSTQHGKTVSYRSVSHLMVRRGLSAFVAKGADEPNQHPAFLACE